MAKIVIEKPYICCALKLAKVKEKGSIMTKVKDVQHYSFYINKVDVIFDLLLANG